MGKAVAALLDRHHSPGVLNNPIDTSILSAGTYAVRLMSDTNTTSTLFVVAR